MNLTTIPEWTVTGTLPPVNPDVPTLMIDRSPYNVSIVEFATRFSTSEERQEILAGYFRFRQEIHELGLVRGFQWLNGSFVEDIESLQRRSPNDIDVVTFFYMPDGETQESLKQNQVISDRRNNKQKYSVDSYFVQIDEGHLESLVELSAFWYGVWSHRQSREWKGYLQVDLSPVDDRIAMANLELY